jgi:ribosomal protein S18 acetylase RimI-like enzyme
MPDEIAIRRMRPDEKPQVLAFLAKAYEDNPRHSDPAFWDWHFLEPPAANYDAPAVWLAMSGDRIAGQMAGLPIDVHIDGKMRTAIWALDFIVDPEFRRRGIGKKLALAMEADFPLLLGVNTDQQHAPALLQGLGWKKVSLIPRFHRILFPGHAVREVADKPAVSKMVNLAFRPLRGQPRSQRPYATRTLDTFDRSFDEFWRTARVQWPCSVERSRDLLEWQFEKQPGKKFDVIGCHKDQHLAGYAVLFFRRPGPSGRADKAAISDICYSPDDPAGVADSLIAASVDLAIERQAGGLVTDTLDELLQARLRKSRFWSIKSPLQLMVKAPEGLESAYEPKNWFLTRGDSDISIFEHPNTEQ